MRAHSILAAFLSFSVATWAAAEDAPPKSSAVSMDSPMGLDLSPDELEQQEQDALSGDRLSAYRLSLFYMRNKEEHLYWLTIAAENGDIPSELNLGKELSFLGAKETYPVQKERLSERGLYWLNLVLKSGDPNEVAQVHMYLDAMKKVPLKK